MRLPARFQTHGWFAISAFTAASIFSFLFAIISYWTVAYVEKIPFAFLIFGPSAGAVSWFLWPKDDQRTSQQMINSGFLTVLFSGFLGYLIFVGGVLYYDGYGEINSTVDLFILILSVAALSVPVIAMGSLITLGIPFFLGTGLAVLFANEN